MKEKEKAKKTTVLNIFLWFFASFGALFVIFIIYCFFTDGAVYCEDGETLIEKKCWSCPENYLVDIENKKCVSKSVINFNTDETIDANKTTSDDLTPELTETLSQKNAVKKAKSYLDTIAFSYEGLIAQLEYEKFSHEDAVYGADNCNADWNEQAYKKAKSYLDTMAFSRDGLIDQLKYEKFTEEQAIYGVNKLGL